MKGTQNMKLFEPGNKVCLRTVTYHLVGEIVARDGDWIELKDAAWVADSGRFMQALEKGELSEVEPVGVAVVNLATVTEAFPWRHELPLKQR